MKLIEAVRQLGSLDRDSTIYARQPWTASSEARLAVEGSGEEKETKAEGLRYFLEVFIAQEFLEEWSSTQEQSPNDEQACARLIEYATNDA